MKTQNNLTQYSNALNLATFLSETTFVLGDYSKMALMGENYHLLSFYENRAPKFLNIAWFCLYLSLTFN